MGTGAGDSTSEPYTTLPQVNDAERGQDHTDEDNETLSPQSIHNGRYVIGNTTFTIEEVQHATPGRDAQVFIVDDSYTTERRSTIQFYTRNLTSRTGTDSTTLLNVHVVIGGPRGSGEDLADWQVRQISQAFVTAFANISTPLSDVTVTRVSNIEADNLTQANDGTVANSEANATAVQLSDLGLFESGQTLAAELPDSVRDTPTRVSIDIAHVRRNNTIETYRDIQLRGTLGEILSSQAETRAAAVNRTNTGAESNN